jgi:hypothetical protein
MACSFMPGGPQVRADSVGAVDALALRAGGMVLVASGMAPAAAGIAIFPDHARPCAWAQLDRGRFSV